MVAVQLQGHCGLRKLLTTWGSLLFGVACFSEFSSWSSEVQWCFSTQRLASVQRHPWMGIWEPSSCAVWAKCRNKVSKRPEPVAQGQGTLLGRWHMYNIIHKTQHHTSNTTQFNNPPPKKNIYIYIYVYIYNVQHNKQNILFSWEHRACHRELQALPAAAQQFKGFWLNTSRTQARFSEKIGRGT